MVKGLTTPYRQRKTNDHEAFELAGNKVNIGDRRTGGVHILTNLVATEFSPTTLDGVIHAGTMLQ